MRSERVGLLALAVLAFASGARADPAADARASFREGQRLYDKKPPEYSAAAVLFERALAEDPNSEHVAAIAASAGFAWQLANEPARAADDYELALAHGGLSATNGADVRARLTTLEKGLAILTVTAADGARIDVAHVRGGRPGLHLHVAPGAYTAKVTFADGRVASRTTTIAAEAHVALDVAEPALGTTDVVAPSTEHGHVARTVAFATLVATAVAGTTGAIFYGVGRSTLDQYEQTDSDPNLRNRAVTYKTVFETAYVVTGLCAAASAAAFVVWFVQSKGQKTQSGALRVVPFGIAGSF